MEARNLTAANLLEFFDPDEIVNQVINGQLELNQEQAEALGKFFHVDGSLFI